MKLSGFSSIITSMFTDKMDIFRYVKEQQPNGTTATILPELPLVSDLSCKLSFVGDENPKNSAVDQTPIMTTPKIFCCSDTDIKAGDFVVIRRINDEGVVVATYSGQIGLPAKFITHQEVLFLIKGGA